MGQIDSEAKDYMKRSDVFADLFNYLIYDGRSVIDPGQLKEMDPTEIAIPYDETGKAYPTQRFRDVMKSTIIKEDSEAAYVLILGVENQTEIHYAMPVKDMLYDALNYASQVSFIEKQHRKGRDPATGAEYLSGMHKNDRLRPVITLVVYFGQETWDGPMSIHEMLPTQNPNLLRLIPDYRINLISPVTMERPEIEKFRSCFRELASLIRCGNDKNAMKELLENEDRLRHVDYQTAKLANDVTGSKLKLTANEKGEVDMCVAMAEIREESRTAGWNEGRTAGWHEGRTAGWNEGRTAGWNEGRTAGWNEGIQAQKEKDEATIAELRAKLAFYEKQAQMQQGQ